MTATATAEHAHDTREGWLVAAIEKLAPLFVEVGVELPAVRVSVGWPGGRGKKGNVIGQCWSPAASADGVSQLFISPVLDDASRVLDVLAHELVHAADRCENGHRAPFAKIAKGIGLEGAMTATVASDELKAKLDAIVEELGAYPHAALAKAADGADGPKKQGTRMLKVECAEGSGYIVRTTAKWLEVGVPSCPCHGAPMLAA